MIFRGFFTPLHIHGCGGDSLLLAAKQRPISSKKPYRTPVNASNFCTKATAIRYSQGIDVRDLLTGNQFIFMLMLKLQIRHKVHPTALLLQLYCASATVQCKQVPANALVNSIKD